MNSLIITISLFFFIFPIFAINDRPIIGILTIPSTADPKYPPSEYSYFGASYVKFIESAGARVIPIHYDQDFDSLKKQFLQINGLLFPGGGSNLFIDESKMEGFANVTLASKYLIELAIEANKNGDYFPVWGTCLGLEMIVMDIAEDSQSLDTFNSENHHTNLVFVNDNSRVFQNLPETLKSYAMLHKPGFFYHKYGKQYDRFLENSRLNSFFKVNTVSQDLDGVWFVSSAEAREFPIYFSQFHPEISIFEWKKEDNANHSRESIAISKFLANFIVNEARKNNHKFINEKDEENSLIYNYNPEKVKDFYEQVYFFKNLKRN